MANTPLVLLHGWAFDHAAWEPLVPELSGAFDILAPDLGPLFPGVVNGLATMIRERWGLAYRENVKMESAPLPVSAGPLFVGWSLGFLVALETAARFPGSRVLGLGALPWFAGPRGIPAATLVAMAAGLKTDREATLTRFRRLAFFPGRGPRENRPAHPGSGPDSEITETQSSSAPHSWLPKGLAWLSRDLRGLAAGIPHRCVLAERDAILPAAAAVDCPGTPVEVLAGIGHAGLLLPPARVAGWVREMGAG